jgi:hypothetical protein
MPFRQTFDCLWCGRPWTTRSPDDLEGWASLCPDCLGRAQDNGFLRFRLHEALKERSQATQHAAPAVVQTPAAPSVARDEDADLRAYYAARAAEYDLTAYGEPGDITDIARQVELDEVTNWVDALPIQGDIVELAAGTGWWSPLLAQKGSLWLSDANAEPLELAQRRLTAHGLSAHVHVRDAWLPPDHEADALFCGFWLGLVRTQRLPAFLALVHDWLRPGGTFAFVDERPAADDPRRSGGPAKELEVRQLESGQLFEIPKVVYAPDELAQALHAAGFTHVSISEPAHFFLMGRATR